MAKAHATPPEDFVTRFQRHLPRSNDLILIVLKGHLLMEEVLDGLILEQLLNPAALEQVRLTFFERLRLARALVAPEVLDDLLDSAEKLNTLRNRIAHNLEPPQLERHVAEFLRLLEDPEVPVAEFEKESTSKRLKRAIACLCGELCGFRKGWAAARSLARK